MIFTAEFLLLVFCVLATGFFAGIETGIISIHPLRLKHLSRQNLPWAQLIEEYVHDPDRLFGTTLFGTNLFTVVFSVTAASMASEISPEWGETIATVASTVIILVFSEYLPKAWFQSRPIDRSRAFIRFLKFWEKVFRPMSRAMVGITRLLVPSGTRTFSEPRFLVTKDDLKSLAKEGGREGVFSGWEQSMLVRVFELSGKSARDIMVPREKMVSVKADAALSQCFEVARAAHYTRLPVTDERTGEVRGILNVFNVLSDRTVASERTARDFMAKPTFLKHTMPVTEILPKLRRSRQPAAFVVDERSTVIGMVTTTDILEGIMGHP